MYEYVKTKFSEDAIIVFGRSMGTGIAAFIASKNSPKKLILESPYYSMHELAYIRFPWLPTKILLKYPIKTYKSIKAIRCPIYIFHGTKDSVIPYESSKKLKQLLKKEDKYISIVDGDHNNLAQFSEYQKYLTLFLF